MQNKKKNALEQKLKDLKPHFHEFIEELANYKAKPSRDEEVNVIILLAIIFDDIQIISTEFSDEIQEISEDPKWFQTSYRKANMMYDRTVAQHSGVAQLSQRLVDELQLENAERQSVSLIINKVLESAHGLYIKQSDKKNFSIYELLNMKSRENVMKQVLESAESLIESVYALTRASTPVPV